MTTETFQFGDITVDARAFHVERGGIPLAITPRAFDVLLFLLRNGGRIVEKQEIFDAVWRDSFVTDNALTRVIKEIRHGLGDDAASPRFIETVPKRGYRFIAPVAVSELSALPPQATAEVDGSPRRRMLVTSAAVIAVLVIGAWIWLISSNTRAKGSSGPIDSIAVLPFRNDSPDTEYLADGITESITDKLSQLSVAVRCARG